MAGMLSVWEKSIHCWHVVCMGEVNPWLPCGLYGRNHSMADMLSIWVEVNPWLVCCLYERSHSMAGMLSIWGKSMHGWYIVCV